MKTTNMTEEARISIKYSFFLARLEDYLKDSPLTIIEDFKSITKNNFSSEESRLLGLVSRDSVKVAYYLHSAKGWIWEAIAHVEKVYHFQRLLWYDHQGNEFEWDKEKIEFYKQQINTYPPLIITYPSEETNLVHRYVSYIANLLTKYFTYKEIILAFLKHYQAEDIIKPELFELWEAQYTQSLPRTDIMIWDNNEFVIHVPELKEVPQINYSFLQDLDEDLLTDLKIEHRGDIKFDYINVYSPSVLEDMKALGITPDDIERGKSE